MKTLIIIPTYNEKENIVKLLHLIAHTAPEAHIVVIDDHSPDGTAAEVSDFAHTTGVNVHLIERPGKLGLGTAYNAGFQYGLERDYEVFVTMDADFSHNPIYLPAMLAAIEEYDVVIGSRYIKDGGTINWPIRRILLSWSANQFARRLLGLSGNDLTSGYRAYRRHILAAIKIETVRSNGYSYLVEMLFRAQQQHARTFEMPIIFVDRTMGKSKISKREIYLGAFTLLRLRLKSDYRRT